VHLKDLLIFERFEQVAGYSLQFCGSVYKIAVCLAIILVLLSFAHHHITQTRKHKNNITKENNYIFSHVLFYDLFDAFSIYISPDIFSCLCGSCIDS
jgi:ABC-type iron transport system FetAB permease component